MTESETVALAKKVERIESGTARDMLGHCDTAMDLALTLEVEHGYSVVPLYGSADRAIYAPVVLAREKVTELPLGVVLGKAAASGQAWMMATAEGAEIAGSATGTLYSLGDVLGGGAIETTHAALDAVGCGSGRSAFLWTMADLDGDGADEAVGVEGTEPCVAASSAASTRVEWMGPTLVAQERVLALALGAGRELVAADLDRDGLVDLVLARSDSLFVAWGAGPEQGWPSAPLRLADTARSLALLDGDAQPGKELACLSDGVLVVFAFDGREPVELARYDVPKAARVLRSGDVNADAVADLVVADAQSVRPYLGTAHLPTP